LVTTAGGTKGGSQTKQEKKPEHREHLTICKPTVGSCPNLREWWSQKCYIQASDVGYLTDIVAKFGKRSG
jgi:hypothetical protein